MLPGWVVWPLTTTLPATWFLWILWLFTTWPPFTLCLSFTFLAAESPHLSALLHPPWSSCSLSTKGQFTWRLAPTSGFTVGLNESQHLTAEPRGPSSDPFFSLHLALILALALWMWLRVLS